MNSHIIDLIISFLKILSPFIIITFISIFFIRILKIKDYLEIIISIFLFNWLQILISIQLFSFFNLVYMWVLLIFYTICAAICVLISIRKKISFKFNTGNFKNFFIKFYDGSRLEMTIKIFVTFFLIVILFVTFFISINVPPSNYDAMTYHLGRTAFWYQNHSINHYYTQYAYQNVQPNNGEIGMFWIILFTNYDDITFLVQLGSLILIIVALYKTLRLLKYNKLTSLISTFLFASFDIVILESNSTQNDLISASFLIVAFYYLIKLTRDLKIDYLNLFLFGMASGMAIGAKGYIYLFAPGFLIYYLLTGKHNKFKYKKFAFIILFFLVGIILFSLNNWIQNYIFYGNFINDPNSIDFFRVQNPGLKSFISNISRHVVSFYQLRNVDHNTIGIFLEQKILYLHNIMHFDISSPATTWSGTQFAVVSNPLEFDDSYFGPLGFFLVLPAIIINLIIFAASKHLRRNKEISERFKQSLLIFIIPALFFILYNYIFRWQPWAGRLFISFMLLMVFNLAQLIDFIVNYKNKVFLYILIPLIILVASYNSFNVSFKNGYYPLIPKDGKNIFSIINYEDRRCKFATGRIGLMNKNNELIEKYTGTQSTIGILSNPGEWTYIYFGKNFTRKIKYIKKEDFYSKTIQNIFKNNNLNGLVVNLNDFPLKSNLLSGNTILEINSDNYGKYIKPLNDCSLSKLNNKIKISVSGNDPYFEFNVSEKESNNDKIILTINLESPIDSHLQIYFKRINSNYNEKDSIIYPIFKGVNDIMLFLDDTKDLITIRVDPIAEKQDCYINKIDLAVLRNINYIQNDYYMFFYK